MLGSTTTIAEERPTMIKLKKGEKAPFEGLLFNKLASAEILVGPKSDLDLKLKHELDLEKAKAKYDLLLGNSKIIFETSEQKNKEILDIKNREIENLYKNLSTKKSDWNAPLGFIAGAAVSILIFYISTKVER
jgi:hypothetical protein